VSASQYFVMSAFLQALRLPHPVRITEQCWPEGMRPLVSVACQTYNHEMFLREAIESFLRQETTFPVEILIHDDASTDSTAEIIREYEQHYPNLIRALYQTVNQRSRGVWTARINLERAQGEFIAYCEGDDYWTAIDKLERQIQAFESLPGCIICGGRSITWHQEDQRFTVVTPKEGYKVGCLQPHEFYLMRDWIKTCTRMVRTSDLLSLPAGYEGDFREVHYLLAKNPGHVICCLPEVVAVYREHGSGVYSGASSLAKLVRAVYDGRAVAGVYGDSRKTGMLYGSAKSCWAIVFHPASSMHTRLTYGWRGVVTSLQFVSALLLHGSPRSRLVDTQNKKLDRASRG